MLRERFWPPNLQNQLRKLRRELEAARIDNHDQAWRLDRLEYPGAEIMLDVRSGKAMGRTKAARKEPLTVSWIEALPAGDVLYDIGANVGAYSLIGAMRPQGPLQVFSFEPGYATFAALCDNIVANRTADRMTPIPVPLGERTEVGSFDYSDVRAGAARHGGTMGADGEDSAFVQPVLIFRLDDLVERFALPAPQHIKLDVDGAELAVLRGAGELLDAPTLRTLMVELSPDIETEVDGFIRERGFEQHDSYQGETATVRYVQYGRS